MYVFHTKSEFKDEYVIQKHSSLKYCSGRLRKTFFKSAKPSGNLHSGIYIRKLKVLKIGDFEQFAIISKKLAESFQNTIFTDGVRIRWIYFVSKSLIIISGFIFF
jgi:hypothetical protein